MARGTVELPLAADRAGGGPLTSQIAGQLREALTDGRLAAGERLPSTRALADLLGVSRTVVTGAYAQLFAEGWLEGRHGSGTYVAHGTQGGPLTSGVPGPAARRVRGQRRAAPEAERDGGGRPLAGVGDRGGGRRRSRWPGWETELGSPGREVGCRPWAQLRSNCGPASRGSRESTRPRGGVPGAAPALSCPSSHQTRRGARTCAALWPATCGAAGASAAPRTRFW